MPKEEIAETDSALFVQSTKTWATRSLNVCWEDAAANFVTEKGWVRDALTGTWSAESGLIFRGFGQCTADPTGIHVIFKNGGNRGSWAYQFGTDLGGVTANDTSGGITINTWATTNGNCYSTTRSREQCVRFDTTHEFGHALAFAHEHNRTVGKPATCTAASAGPDGDTTVGPWDLNSVMNYCSPTYGNERLSAVDVQGVQQFYGSSQPISVSTVGTATPSLFARGMDNALYQNWWNGSAWQWTSHGSVPLGSHPSTVTFGGNPSVFVRHRDDGSLWQRYWDGSAWQWSNRGGTIHGAPSAVAWGGNISVFAHGSDNALWEHRWNGTTWQWISHGDDIIGAPSAISWSANTVSAFVLRADRTLAQRHFNGTTWSWLSQGGTGITSVPAAITQGGTIKVFVRGADGALWENYWDGSSWLWSSHGGVFRGVPSPMTPFSVFVRGDDDTLYQNWWTGSSWQWVAHGGTCTASPAATNADGVPRVFARTSTGEVAERYWNGSVWSWTTHVGGVIP